MAQQVNTTEVQKRRTTFDQFYTRPTVSVEPNRRGGPWHVAWTISTYGREHQGHEDQSFTLEVQHDHSGDLDTTRLYVWHTGDKLEVLDDLEVAEAEQAAEEHGHTWDREDWAPARCVDSMGIVREVLTSVWVQLNQVAAFSIAAEH